MNRIYQGRVTKVELANPDKKAAEGDKWLPFHSEIDQALKLHQELMPEILRQREQIGSMVKGKAAALENGNKEAAEKISKKLAEAEEKLRSRRKLIDPAWQKELWTLHCEYQNAVNYYFAVFAAMVPDRCEVRGWREYRDAVERVWCGYRGRKGEWELPFANVCEVVGLTKGGSFADFRCALFKLTETKALEEQRFAALVDLFQCVDAAEMAIEAGDDSTEDALKNKAEGLFGEGFKLLSAVKTGATDKKTRAIQAKKAAEIAAKVRTGDELKWPDVMAFMTKEKTEPWSRKDAVKGFNEAFQFVLAKLKEKETKVKKPETKSELQSLIQGMNEAKPLLDDTLADENVELPKEKPVRAGRGGEDMKAAMLVSLCGKSAGFLAAFLHFADEDAPASIPQKDMCHEARHVGGVERPVFPLYADLKSGRFRDADKYSVAWEDFEKGAFNEVFVKIGQFRLTGTKFEKRLIEAETLIRKIEDELKAEPECLLCKVEDITESLAEGVVGEDGLPRRYRIRERTLKRWPDVKKEWKAMLNAANGAAVTEKELVAAKNKLQKRLREKFGSAALFEELAKPANHPLWLAVPDKDDPLERWAEYEEALEERLHLKTPRVFTPAHAEKSPRFLRWSATKSKEHIAFDNKQKFSAGKRPPFAVDVKVFDFSSNEKRTLRLHYQAPRMLRDEMRKHDEKLAKEKPDCAWLPPALKPVVEKYKLTADKQTFFNTSVRLAPRSESDVQLVFEANISNEALNNSWKEKFPFTKYEPKDKKTGEKVATGILWPRESAGGDSKKIEWHKQGHVTCLAVDLGINNAAALQVMEARLLNQRPATGVSHQLAPNDGEGKPAWWVKSVENRLVRLQGEDRWLFREEEANDKATKARDVKKALAKLPADNRFGFLPELSGSAGRNATPAETKEAEKWFCELAALGDDFHARFPRGAVALSFPQQNDELLFGLTRLRSQLFRLHRWAEHIFGGEPQKVRPEYAAKVKERHLRRQKLGRDQLKELKKDDPLLCLKDVADDDSKLKAKLAELIETYRNKLVELLPLVSDRVLPSRRGHHVWWKAADGWHQMLLCTDKPRPDAWLAGQRGLSTQRLRQLKNLRQMAQSLNHLCRHEFAKRYQTGPRELIPEPFEGCRQALEDAREDRVKQIAHAIFAAALGVELDVPPGDKKKQKSGKSLHGVYRCNRSPVNFIALERLGGGKGSKGGYRTSDKQSRRENRQLAEWKHREIHKVLKDLCDMVGIQIVYVDPSFTSRMSGKDHRIGFRAEEVFKDDPRIPKWKKAVEAAKEEGGENEDDLKTFVEALESLPEGKSLLLPRRGGSVFVALKGEVPGSTYQADLNAAYRIGLRAMAHPDQKELFGKARAAPVASGENGENRQGDEEKNGGSYLIEVTGEVEGCRRVNGIAFPVVRDSEHLWDKVNGKWAEHRCVEINRVRLETWGVPVPDGWWQA